MQTETKFIQKGAPRLKWIDLAKAVGIILVVWAHALPKENDLWNFINQFHMPLFYFISGYLYLCKDRWKDFLYKKIKNFAFPYVFCSYLTLIIMVLCGKEAISVKKVIKIALLLERGPLLGAIWFLGVLFYAIIIYDLMHRILKQQNFMNKNLILCLLCFAGIVAGVNITLPFRISNVLVAVGFIHLGQLCRNNRIMDKLSGLIVVPFVGLVAFIAKINFVSVSTNTYTSPGLFLIAAIAGSGSVFIICRELIQAAGEENMVIKHLIFIGKNTIGIVIWQFWAFKIIMLLQIVVYKLPMAKLVEYPVIYQYAGWGWVLWDMIAAVYASILFHRLGEKLITAAVSLIKLK